MSDLTSILETLVADARSGHSGALCTIVRTKGSTPQGVGAAMVVRGDFSTMGTLGGGCVEAEVRRDAFELLKAGRSGLLDYVLDHDDAYEDGLICGGRMIVAVTPIRPGDDLEPFRRALESARRRRPATLPIRVEHEGKRLGYRLHLEPAPTLLIAGAGHVGQAVARLARELDFHIVAIDDRADFASPERFPPGSELIVDDIAPALARFSIDPSTYVVIVTRGHRHDQQALEAVINSDAAYIGLIGSRRKARLILADLKDGGIPDDRLERVHTPIGLPISAVTVPEIAVSILAELIQTRRLNAPKLVEPLDA